MSRRIGNPNFSAAPSLESSNQIQIDDLVARNKTLEHTNKKLLDEVASVENRAKESLANVQKQWDENQNQWRQGCHDLLASCRIVQKKIQVELEMERINVIKEMKITREEKLQRLRRDYKIKLFQMKEEELDMQIEELEKVKWKLNGENELAIHGYEEKCATLAMQLRTSTMELEKVEKSKADAQRKLEKLLEKYANQQASHESTTAKLERTKLQLDGALTKNTDLERANDELKRTNAEHHRQLDKWQNLETKEGQEADSQRKQRIALEVELRKLRDQYADEKIQHEETLEKEKQRMLKWKTKSAEWEAAARENEEGGNTTKKEILSLQKQIEKLRSDLETERGRVRPPSPKSSHPVANVEKEVVEEISANSDPSPPPRKRNGTAKPASKQAPRQRASRSQGAASETETEAGPSGKPASKTRKGKQAVLEANDSENEIEEIENPKKRAQETDASDTETTDKRKKGRANASKINAPPKVKRKRRPSESDQDVMEVEVNQAIKAKGSTKARNAALKPDDSKKPPSRPGSRQPVEKGGDDPPAEPAPKKKRKINIFPTNNGAQAFNFGMGGLGDDGLAIPSVLSPIKESDPVPERSNSILGGLGSIFLKRR